MKKIYKITAGFLGATLGLFGTGHAIAQNNGDTFSLEEIVITGRKREESLTDVPVSISVLGESLLADTGILTQNELFELVPGIYYDEGPDRNAAFPSVRGVQSNEIATNRTKVTAFVDGMPILGSQGAIGFGNAAQVEVYRGPQSAAFGRSTFGGAINYVTRDPGDTFEANISMEASDYGRRLVRGGVSGPLTDTIGYMINGEYEDSSAPDEFVASDGTQYGARGTESISGKLVFTPSDSLNVELSFSHTDVSDGPTAEYYITEEARDACFADGGFINPAMMGGGLYIDGTMDCDWSQGASLYAQNDRTTQLENAFDNAAFAAQFPQYQGLTAQQQDDLLFLAQSQSVEGDYMGAQDERDRFTAQVDYLMDSGNAIQFSFMKSEEYYIRGNDTGRDPTTPITFAPGMMGSPWDLVDMGPAATLGTIMSDPTDINETYAEIRWVSPAEERLRYVVGASFYDYDFLTTLRFNGYGAFIRGTDAIDRYAALTGVDVTIPTNLLGESATNSGIFFNATYDVTDRLAVTAEGRYQNDEVSGTDTVSGASGSVTTTAFVPRLSFNYSLNDTTSFYGQYAIGNNPAGVNVGFFNPAKIASLNAANDLFVTSGGTEGAPYTVESVASFNEEKLTNVEFGMKGSALDGRLQYSTAVYFMKWKDNVQPTNLYWGPTLLPGERAAAEDGNRTFVNNGDQKMKGVEFEGNFALTQNFSLRGTLGLLDAEYTDYCDIGLVGGLGPYAESVGNALFDGTRNYPCYTTNGNVAKEQPTVTASLSPSYRADLADTGMRWNARADIRYETGQWREAANIAKTASFTQVNLSAGLTGDNWGATLYINNATDDDTPRNYTSGEDYSIIGGAGLGLAGPEGQYNDYNFRVTPRQQRTVGVRLNYDF
jgi:iron complex outermembrane receptor protein